MADDVAKRHCRALFEQRHRGGPLQFNRDDGDGAEYYSSATQHEFADSLEFFNHGVAFQQQRELAAMRAEIAKLTNEGRSDEPTNTTRR